ncbi:MAG TPA: exo-alpha-sialidase [Actinomycetota bacterium]|nr:exo-alpha-sialidase [Actinomycetota bacterium]
MTELLVGTKKGLFVLRGDPASGTPFEVVTRAFPGDVVEFAVRDPRSGRTFASVTSGFYGPRLFFTDGDPAGEWTQADGPVMPDGTDATIDRTWVVVPGEADGQLWAGVAPAALFESRDSGTTWALNEALWSERVAGDWQPGAGGLALHSICPWPEEPERLAVAVSAAGAWITEDGGRSWRAGFAGLDPHYVPEEMRPTTNVLCVHNMHRAPTRPERLFLQFHGSVYRSDDEGGSWNDVAAGLPSGFGFPLAIDPADPDSAFVIPLNADTDRVTPDGRVRVYETRDAGATWTARTEGLPDRDAYLTVYRQAFATAGEGDGLNLYFGATSGDVFGSSDAGATWFSVRERLAPVNSVRVG